LFRKDYFLNKLNRFTQYLADEDNEEEDEFLKTVKKNIKIQI